MSREGAVEHERFAAGMAIKRLQREAEETRRRFGYARGVNATKLLAEALDLERRWREMAIAAERRAQEPVAEPPPAPPAPEPERPKRRRVPAPKREVLAITVDAEEEPAEDPTPRKADLTVLAPADLAADLGAWATEHRDLREAILADRPVPTGPCALHGCLAGASGDLTRWPEFADLAERHARFHAVADRVRTAPDDAARAAAKRELPRVAMGLATALARLEHAVRNGASAVRAPA